MVDMRTYLKETSDFRTEWSLHSTPRISNALCHCQICTANKKEFGSRGKFDWLEDLISNDMLMLTLDQCFLFPKCM